MGQEKTMKYRPFNEHLDEALKDPKEAVLFLNAVIEENDTDALLLALAHVARAHGITKIAKHSGLQRESIYKMFRPKGNPEFRSIMKILEASGLQMSVKMA
jgi:probable addiction module antidote protein